MYQLTIDSARSGTAVTAHSDRPAACDALLRHAVAADVYLHAVEDADLRSTYHLVQLADRPRTAGHAVIEPMSAAAETLYRHAGEAHRWIGAHSTSPAGHPARVLACARGAATSAAQAAILWVEAAALAGVEPVPDVDPVTLHDLAYLITTGPAPMSTAQLAIMVAAAETGPDVGAALTWWVALRTWAGLPS